MKNSTAITILAVMVSVNSVSIITLARRLAKK